MTSAAGSQFVYVTFIRTTPEKLWEALTSPDFARQYWFGMHIETTWQQGAPWRLPFTDGRVADRGHIAEIDPPRRLKLTWHNEWKPEFESEGDTIFTADLEPVGAAVKLTITHGIDAPDSPFIGAVSDGWSRILSNLKSLLETGEIVLARTT